MVVTGLSPSVHGTTASYSAMHKQEKREFWTRSGKLLLYIRQVTLHLNVTACFAWDWQLHLREVLLYPWALEWPFVAGLCKDLGQPSCR